MGSIGIFSVRESWEALSSLYPDGISEFGSFWGPHKLSRCVLGYLEGGQQQDEACHVLPKIKIY